MSTIDPGMTGRKGDESRQPHRRKPARAPPKPLTVSPAVAAEMTGLSLRTVWNYIADGSLRSVRLGRRRLIVFSSLEALLFGKDAA